MTHEFDQDYWDRIWTGDRAVSMATGDPHPHLVEEIGDLPPGTALDAGCGAGAEAVWLAERGWQVTGADVATEALLRAAERASAHHVDDRVQWIRADLSTWQPPAAYDLVTTHYAHPSIPQLEFYDRLATWVAPGGTLLIVGHLGHHDHASTGQHDHATGPPAEASVTADSITERLDPTGWEVVTARSSHRTLGGRGGHPVVLHDVVVRARRLTHG